METIAVIFVMATITFGCRYLFFTRGLRLHIGPKLKKALTYTAPAVLTAMWVPIVFSNHSSNTESVLSSPYLYAGLFAVILSLTKQNTLIVVFASMGTFLLLDSFFKS